MWLQHAQTCHLFCSKCLPRYSRRNCRQPRHLIQTNCVSALLTHLEMVWWRTPLHRLGTVAPGSPRWAGRNKLHRKRGVSCSSANACALVSFFWYSILLSRAWFCPVTGRHTTPKIPWAKWAQLGPREPAAHGQWWKLPFVQNSGMCDSLGGLSLV